MKIRVMSDLHLEGQVHYYESKGEDVVVLPGDISSKPGLAEWFLEEIKVPKIIVAGNHEYYGHNYDDHVTKLKSIGYQHNEIVQIQDVAFICGTMWSNFELFGIEQKWFCTHDSRRWIRDFEVIRRRREDGTERTFSIRDCEELHEEFVAFLQYALRETEGMKRVVVTHFVPHPSCVHPRWSKSSITPYFCSDMRRFMGWEGLWLAGHTHDSFDIMEGDTRVVINPKGYGKENVGGFKPDLIVEI